MGPAVTSAIHKAVLALPDRPYIYLFYYRHTGRWLRLRNPRLFTHKIQWLKLKGKMERFAPFADKYTVRDYVGRTIGAEYLVPLLGVWDSADAIPFDSLPGQFVLKVTTGCGFNLICKDKSKLDIEAAKAKLRGWLKEDFYRAEREPQYKPHVPRIIAEQHLQDDSGGLRDYKVHCSGGEPYVIQVDIDRFTGHKTQCFDTGWQPINSLTPPIFSGSVKPVARPETLEKMLGLARRLSADFPYVRVDFYSVRNKVYFGELTFTPGSGVVALPEEGELMMGKLINLDAYRQTMPFEAA